MPSFFWGWRLPRQMSQCATPVSPNYASISIEHFVFLCFGKTCQRRSLLTSSANESLVVEMASIGFGWFVHGSMAEWHTTSYTNALIDSDNSLNLSIWHQLPNGHSLKLFHQTMLLQRAGEIGECHRLASSQAVCCTLKEFEYVKQCQIMLWINLKLV